MKTTKLNKKNTEIGNYYGIRTLLVSVGETTLKRELEDGKYVILQSHSGETRPVLAFEVDGNFKIRSITGGNDIANLAAEVWHLRFSPKQKTALKRLRKLKQILDKLEKEIVIGIKRSESVKRR